MDDARLTDIIATALAEAGLEDNAVLREELDLVKAQFAQLAAEDRGWLRVLGQDPDDDEGLTLDTLKEVSKRLKQSVAGSPIPKNANALRHSYTFSAPFIIPNLTASTDTNPGEAPRRGRPPKIKSFFNDPVNQRYVFGKDAQEIISTACSTDGIYLALVKNGKTRPVPLKQITGYMTNPDFTDEVWAYQRTWSPGEGKEAVSRWYYTDRFTGARAKTLASATDSSVRVKVDEGSTMVDLVVNAQVGWTFGVPDLMAGEVWNKMYVTMMNHGQEVSATLAYYAAKVRNKSKAGAANVGVRLGANGGAGKTVAYGEGNEIDVFSSAGKVYAFEDLRPVAAMYALSVSVSIVDLLASPSAAGSSYGSAAALAPGQRRAIESRRSQIAAWMERIIKVGAGEVVQITPASIEEIEPYRRAQIGILAWNSGLVHDDELRPELLHQAGITPMHDSAPEGVMLPNNKNSLPRQDVDADASNATPPTAAAPGQGQATGNGGAGSTAANDNRTDTVS